MKIKSQIQELNTILFYLSDKTEFIGAYEISQNTKCETITNMARLEALGIIETNGNTSMTGRTYLMKYEAKQEIAFLPSKYQNNPYEYFCKKVGRKPKSLLYQSSRRSRINVTIPPIKPHKIIIDILIGLLVTIVGGYILWRITR